MSPARRRNRRAVRRPDERSDQARVVLITGASSGIGRALAAQLAARGDRLVLSSRSLVALQEVAQECRRSGADVAVVVTVADVTDPSAVDDLIAGAAERFDRVDAVVHSAGALAYGRFPDLPADVFEGTLEVVLGGTARVARSALRQFARQGHGQLVVVGSVLGKIAAPTMSAYVTAKWAVHGLVRCLQVEARDTPGIAISLITPGGVDTPIYRQAGTYTGRRGSPPPPVASPETVAAAIVRALDAPRRETTIGLFNHVMVQGFRLAPALFDRLVGPLFGRLAQSREAGVAPNPGNVLRPVPEGEAVRGGYGRWGFGAD